VELLEIDETTEDTYYRCLHDEIPSDPRVMSMRREWRAMYKPKGHRAKVLKDDAGQVVGLTNYIPIEYSPYEGENLMAILCMWIHGYDHLVGNQQSQGYGRFMLEQIEADAKRSGCDGVTVWGKDYDAWSPISFYEHMGYQRVDQSGIDVLAWKSFTDKAKAPRLMKPTRVEVDKNTDTNKVQVTNITNGWCGGGCHQCMLVRDAVADIADKVELTQIYAHEKAEMRLHGESIDVVYVDGESYLPDGPPYTKEDLKNVLLKRYSDKNTSG